MIRNVALGGLLVAASVAYGMDVLENKVTMPNQEEIKKRLEQLNLPPTFDEITYCSHHLHTAERLGDVLTLISYSMQKYITCVKLSKTIGEDVRKVTALYLESKRRPLLYALLQDQPDLVEKIKKEPQLEQWH